MSNSNKPWIVVCGLTNRVVSEHSNLRHAAIVADQAGALMGHRHCVKVMPCYSYFRHEAKRIAFRMRQARYHLACHREREREAQRMAKTNPSRLTDTTAHA
ncbi:MAG TPA: hypothetical protein VFZ16_04880, partial [Hyphomicrobiaceae bacterium]|nr:hypothetical protein [Hyphomicrobiaceae bacterium]